MAAYKFVDKFTKRIPKKYLSFICALLYANNASALSIEDQNQVIKSHNHFRQELSLPAIKWSKKLEQSSQNYANKLAKRGCVLQHSGIKNIGENIYWASALTRTRTTSDGVVTKSKTVQTINGTQVVEAWGSEKSDYDYETNSCQQSKQCGHYTQMIWRMTTQIGCAKAVCDNSAQVWVCHYSPPGNYVGERPF